jgi:CheY-like chemotaxis protein
MSHPNLEPTADASEPAAQTPPAPSPWPRPGDLVAERYRIEELLGEGGMGAVYRARDLELDEVVALKVLKPAASDGAERLARFKQETRLARRIRHRNVCRTYDFGSCGELRFVTMEWVPGRTLESLMKDSEDSDLDARLELFGGVLAGLGAAHDLGIVHRDIKPQNVMVTGDGRPVVMDFGIARELADDGLTADGDVIGTPEYMAPERLLGTDVDHRSDIYSLGVLLFQLATGSLPFSGDTIFEIARNQISKDPPRPTEIDPRVPRWLEDLILEMLAKRPEDRVQSVAEVIDRLTAAARRKTVLVIDDDPGFRKLAGDRLSQAGLEVVVVESAGEGMARILNGGAPDLVCLEFDLSEMDGFHLADYLRQLEPERRPPLFMVTAKRDPQYEKQAARHGIERFFTKHRLNIEAFVGAIIERLSDAAGNGALALI